MKSPSYLDRRQFHSAIALGSAVSVATALGGDVLAKKVRVGIIGCGSVSRMYFPNLKKSPHAEIVSACDIVVERAKNRAAEFGVANVYPNIEEMLAGAPFDLLVNLTDMQEHEHLNRKAIQAGKHVWSEKPIANSLAAGQELLKMAVERGQRLWGAPTVVQSPQFEFMAKTLAKGLLGSVATAHASYGHLGPDWSSFFYEKNGGSLPDLGVYQLSFMTGLFGPAKSVTAMTSIITPQRNIQGKGEITVGEEDNAVVVMSHASGVISHVESSFNFFNPNDHAYAGQDHHTLTVTGRKGVMKLAGYDWGPHGVDLSTQDQPEWKRHAGEPHDYVWENGASLVCECLATGKEPLVTPEHALHVVEIMTAARESQATGKHIPMTSTFKWPIF
ncbi:MAG: Gfo/Idh/MocA family oxidoreductase [Planctomycetaceae bacterium]|nr:Gfo/Idh/MocA family oxidoreductase [Planctomycetaceae bacterium]